MNKNVYVVIMAGGQGTRLWPLGRKDLPKQLLPFEDNKTLLDLTVQRIEKFVEPSHRWVVTTEKYKTEIQNQLGSSIDTILAEPAMRNTGPAILYTCLELYKQDPDASVVFLPADHFIKETDQFADDLTTAIDYAEKNNVISLLGLQPTHPATGYGYIEYEQTNSNVPEKIINFHEKPNLKTAKEYINASNMLWNIGIFCGPVKTFINEYTVCAPELTKQVKSFTEGACSYDSIQNISVDNAVMEKSSSLYVLPVHFTWSDIGNLETFLSLQKNHNAAHVISIESKNNVVYVKSNGNKQKIVALIGVHDLCIVETEDALLISRTEDVEKVKQLQETLTAEKLDTHL